MKRDSLTAISTKQIAASINWKSILLFCIVVVSLVSFFTTVLSAEIGIDFRVWYTAGKMWTRNEDLYNHDLFTMRLKENATSDELATDPINGFFYLPLNAMLSSALTFFTPETAHSVFVIIQIFFILMGIGLSGLIYREFAPIRFLEIAILIALLNTGFSRAAIRHSQISLFVFPFILGSFYFFLKRKEYSAGALLGWVILKPTFLPLFALYYTLKRPLRFLLTFIPVLGVLVLVPVIIQRKSPVETITGWLNTNIQYSNQGVNDPSPFAPFSAFLQNFQPLFYRVVNTDAPWATVSTWSVLAVTTIIVFFMLLKSKSGMGDQLLDFALVSALSLVVVYHRQYDVFLLFPGLMFLLLFLRRLPIGSFRTILCVVLILVFGLHWLPGNLIQSLEYRFPELSNSYVFRLAAPYQAWSGVILLAALMWIKVKRQALDPIFNLLSSPVPR